MSYPRISSPAGVLAGVMVIMALAGPAGATDGYFSHGYGIQSKGMAGVSLAYPKDSLAIATNPASAAVLGTRIDAGIDYFQPTRSATITGNAFGPDQSFGGNARDTFVIPELGAVYRINDRFSAGVAVYGNGGMNTSYTVNPYSRFGAAGAAGVDLQQMFLSPTVAAHLTEDHSLGVSLNVAYQTFKARGVGAFGGFSAAPANVSDQGRDSAAGIGVRVGWLGQITPWLTAGASWQSKTYSQDFTRYSGLFSGQGSFDIPSTYGLGIAVKATGDLDLALDVRRIEYSGVHSVGNDFQRLLEGQAFGSPDGPGFGWRDTTSVKIGANYRLTPEWQIRAGYSFTTEPISANQTFLNILAPATIQHQLTTGATWTVGNGLEVSAFALYGLPKTVKGGGSIPPGFPPGGLGGGEADIRLSEFSAGVGVGWRF
jgi:long-chain fatty acid transport protein